MRISVIVGSVRLNRFALPAAEWIMGHLEKRGDVTPMLLDLQKNPMPFYAESFPPAMKKAPFPSPYVEAFTGEIAASDGFVFVTGEYNHGVPAVLKNALDYVYREWNKKPAAFVGYGGLGGARAIEQLRLSCIELQMAPLRSAVHLPAEVVKAHATKQPIEPILKEADRFAETCIDELLWWANALKAAREQSHAPTRMPANDHQSPPSEA